jgi:hypothetical protein
MLRRHRVLIAIAAVVFAALAGVAVWRWATPPALSQGASPEAVTRTYFELDAAGRSWAARHFVWQAGRVTAPNGRGYRGARIIDVGKAVPTGKEGLNPDYGSLAQLCEVSLDYRSTLTDEIGNPPGRYAAFALLGRETPTGPWRLLEIGCGP